MNGKLQVRKKVIWIVTVSGNWGMRNFRGCWCAASFSNGFGSQQQCKSWLYTGYLDIIRNICSICKSLYPDKGVQASRYWWELSTWVWPFPDNVDGSGVTSHRRHNGQELGNFGCYFACCCTIHLLLAQFPCVTVLAVASAWQSCVLGVAGTNMNVH